MTGFASLGTGCGVGLGTGWCGVIAPDREPPAAWVLTVDTTGPGQSWTVAIAAGIAPNIVIAWGDGAVDTYTSLGNKTHTYAVTGRWRPKISGSFTSGGNIRLGSNYLDNFRLKATGVVPLIVGLSNFYSTFSNCTELTSLPADLFRYNTAVSTSGFRSTFSGCAKLASLPVDLFRYNTAVSTSGFYGTFSSCTNLATLPVDLFRYNTAVSTSGFMDTFSGCYELASLPADLFRYNTAVSTSGFYGTFSSCTNLATLPVDLFRYNTAVSTSGFVSTFSGCAKLASLPADLFRYNTAVSTSGFMDTFSGCYELASLPADLFRYNTAVSTSGFVSTFAECTNLASLPADLFRYNTECSLFIETFRDCDKLQLRSDIFFQPEEAGTRFFNRASNFASFAQVGGFTGTQGTAPALWTCNFGSGVSVTRADCFAGHTPASVSNYASIPTAWGGPA